MIDYKKVILGTGNYDNVKSGNTVSITGDGGNAWNYYGPSFRKLAPKLITWQEYDKGYQELQLLDKNSQEYWVKRNKIEEEYIKSYCETRISDYTKAIGLEGAYNLLDTLYDKYGYNIILLCHESVEEFCHRRLIADFIKMGTEIYIPEISIDENGLITKHKPINYKKVLKKYI